MSIIPISSLDEFFGILEADHLQQPTDLSENFWNQFTHDDKIKNKNENSSKSKYLEQDNPNSWADIIFELNYIYGHTKFNYEAYDETTKMEQPYSLPYMKPDLFHYEVTDAKNKLDLELFNDVASMGNHTGQVDSFESRGDVPKHSIEPQFNYDNICINQDIIECKLSNFAANRISESTMNLILLQLKERKKADEERIFSLNRVRYNRESLDLLSILHPYVKYQLNTQFSTERPYEPQYIRVQINPLNNLPINETRCGLCPYCPELVFKNLKTSTYAQHLSLTHGIQTDNYITPDPLFYGSYNLKKRNTNRKTKAHISEKNGVVCPVCHEIIETECSRTTATRKPLNNYLRHFREKHRKYKEREEPMRFFSKISLIKTYDHI